ncbi:MAG: molybdopterin-dependent oxidoreductase, partial [Acidobacteriia bacterium]|nr:molybdopterin-dependent oxidoreductase [Terriglobia bacterium]
GNPQATFAIDSQIDILAEMAGIDPLDFRLRNTNTPGEITPQNFKINTCGLKECIDSVAEKLDWRQNRGRCTFTATTTSAWPRPAPLPPCAAVRSGSRAPSTAWASAPATPTSARSPWPSTASTTCRWR